MGAALPCKDPQRPPVSPNLTDQPLCKQMKLGEGKVHTKWAKSITWSPSALDARVSCRCDKHPGTESRSLDWGTCVSAPELARHPWQMTAPCRTRARKGRPSIPERLRHCSAPVGLWRTGLQTLLQLTAPPSPP